MVHRQYTSETGFDLRLEAKLKNARLVNARESLGLQPRGVAEQIGVGYQRYLDFEAMRRYPSPETQRKIIEFYLIRGVPLVEEEVFPEELRQVKPQKRYIAERTIPKDQLLSLSYIDQRQLPPSEPEAEQRVIADELTERLNSAFASLTDSEQQVLRMRFFYEGDKPPSYEQISQTFGLTPETIRLTEKRALRHLRHPSRKLRDLVE